MSTDKAVVLAEKHGAQVFFKEMPFGFCELTMTEQQLTAMLAERDQQHTAELAQRSEVAFCGVIDRNANFWNVDGRRRPPPDGKKLYDSEAIAAMQAQIEQEERDHAGTKDAFQAAFQKLQQAEARVAELKNDAERFRLLLRSTGKEFDISTPGKQHTLRIDLDCAGCEKYLPDGAFDFASTIRAVLDDELLIQKSWSEAVQSKDHP